MAIWGEQPYFACDLQVLTMPQFFVSLSVYTTLSLAFPAKETFVTESSIEEESIDWSQKDATQVDAFCDIPDTGK